MGKVTGKGSGFLFSTFFYYFGSIFFAHFIPWSTLLAFAVISSNLWEGEGKEVKISGQQAHGFHRRWLLFATPAIILLLLTFISTEHKHYALPIYSFAALLIAADLEHRLAAISQATIFYKRNNGSQWRALRYIAVLQCCLACIILIFCFVDSLPMVKDIDTTLANMR
ncbi:MAG: hypothetical protein OXF67_02490 [Cyanobacteria bacterium MAG CAR4_bin_6]|nr:hypothetical protein [Cyanobacteria bacterium MAG CAR4_bin_6]